MAVAPMWHGEGESGKGRGEARSDYGIRPRAAEFGWISLVPARIMQLNARPRTPLFRRTMARMRFFYGGMRFLPAGDRGVIVFTARWCGPTHVSPP